MEVNTARQPVPEQAAAVRVQRTALGDRWAEVIRPLISNGNIAALVRELALQAELVAIDTQEAPPLWRLVIERESLRTDVLREKLQAALLFAGNAPLRLQVDSGAVADSIARRNAEAREAAQRDAEAVIRNDPAVRELMAQFPSARIVPGSIKPQMPAEPSSEPSSEPTSELRH
jgi:DNA polymerase-3 subunit gamma/tau